MLTPFALTGPLVTLAPLLPEHAAGLAAAAAEDRGSYAFTNVPDGEAAARRFVEAAEERRRTAGGLQFVVLAAGRVVGTTGFYRMETFTDEMGVSLEPGDDLPPTVLEIGGTWYAASAQRTGVNTACKLLLLTHAFEVWGCARVCLRTDARNARSRAAIERLGAAYEGIRRVELRAVDGTFRDSAYYSITAPEWPAARDGLLRRSAGHPI